MNSQILISQDVLSPSYLPEKLLYREKEKAELVKNLKNLVNTFIFGPYGSGKTTLAKLAIRELDKKLSIAYVDCSVYQTTYSVLKEIIPKSELILYRSNYELIKELARFAKGEFIVCFDNFEKLKEKDLIARLMSLNLCVILISDEEENLSLLNESVRSNIPSRIRLRSYSVEQIFEILKSRAEKALARWSYSDALIKKIAEKSKGNLALGVNALKAAALRAENEGRKIKERDIEMGNTFRLKLSYDEKILLNILKECKSLPASRLYGFYVQNAKHAKGERSFRNYMENLCKKGFVRAVGEKRGRIYEVVEGDLNS